MGTVESPIYKATDNFVINTVYSKDLSHSGLIFRMQLGWGSNAAASGSRVPKASEMSALTG